MKVLVAMNGGIKSLVTAWLLKKQGMQIRGVYFDWAGQNETLEKVEVLERKLGISIQIGAVKVEYEEKIAEARAQAIKFEQIFNPKLFFHQSFLFPKLMQLKEQHGFDKVSTGHRVLIHEDQVAGLFRVFQNADHDLRDVLYLIGQNQKALGSLLLPLGSIPMSMFDKLAKELEMGESSKATSQDSSQRMASDSASSSQLEVVTSAGSMLGFFPNGKIPKPGAIYRKEDQPEKYRIVDVNLERRQVWVRLEADLKAEEVHFYDAAWFNGKDLGMKSLSCGITSLHHPKVLPLRLLQYEGGRVKGFLNHALLAEDANIFKGQTMLWVEGQEILGGGRVLQTR